MTLQDYYKSLTTDEKRKFFVQCMKKCHVGIAAVRSWIRDPENKAHRNPDVLRRPILAKITGLTANELFN